MRQRGLLALIFGLFIYGFNLFKVCFLLSANFALGRYKMPSISWSAVIIMILWLKPMEHFFSIQFPSFKSLPQGVLGDYWVIVFNLSILRVLSFNMDFYYHHKDIISGKDSFQRDCVKCGPEEDCLCGRARVAHPPISSTKSMPIQIVLKGEPNISSEYKSVTDNSMHWGDQIKMLGEKCVTLQMTAAECFSVDAYFAYVLYPPLLLAGPIMTFNDFSWQVFSPLKIKVTYCITYAVRWTLALLSMELLQHLIHVVAIKEARVLDKLSVHAVCYVSFWNLMLLWLKLLVVWRFFRLAALFDGIDCQDNMGRCMVNNHSVAGFWRGWHRSFNAWIVRYMYIPLGGSAKGHLNAWPIFFFVAIWHDVDIRLLSWALLIGLVLVIEGLIFKIEDKLKLRERLGAFLINQVHAATGALGMLVLSLINLVGYVLGLEETRRLASRIASESAVFVVSLFIILYAAVQLQISIRRWEVSRGVCKNY